MAIQDFATQVSAAQVLGTGATQSTSSVPLGGNVQTRDIEFEVNVSAVGGTGPTLAVEMIAADSADLLTNPVSVAQINPVIAAAMAAKNFYIRGALLTKKAFVGLKYTMAGTTPAATVSAAVVSGIQRDYQKS